MLGLDVGVNKNENKKEMGLKMMQALLYRLTSLYMI